jgi:hypothetical protein
LNLGLGERESNGRRHHNTGACVASTSQRALMDLGKCQDKKFGLPFAIYSLTQNVVASNPSDRKFSKFSGK